MNLRWLWLNHFPKDLAISREERKKALLMAKEFRQQAAKRAARPARLHPRYMYFIWSALICAACVVLFIYDIYYTLILAYLLLSLGTQRTNAPSIRRALRRLGHPVCVECGYILTGLGKDVVRCPECGTHPWVSCQYCNEPLRGRELSAGACPGCEARIPARRLDWLREQEMEFCED